MSVSVEGATNLDGIEVADELTALAAVHTSSSPSRRSAGESRIARNARLIAAIAARLSEIMDFGHLEEQDLYTISHLSDYLKVSLRTLRFYEQSGFLRPVREGNRRLYSRRDIDKLKIIVTLRDLEGTLGSIKALMNKIKDADDPAQIIAAIEGVLVSIATSNHNRIAELARLNRRIDATLGILRRGE